MMVYRAFSLILRHKSCDNEISARAHCELVCTRNNGAVPLASILLMLQRCMIIMLSHFTTHTSSIRGVDNFFEVGGL